MKLSELHYIQLLDETRQALIVGDDTAFTYLMEVRHRLSAGEEAVKKVAELEQEISKVVFYPCYKREMEATMVKIAELEKEVERLKDHHCIDCCCAQSWKALGITEYTGKSIPENIEKLKADKWELVEVLESLMELFDACMQEWENPDFYYSYRMAQTTVAKHKEAL